MIENRISLHRLDDPDVLAAIRQNLAEDYAIQVNPVRITDVLDEQFDAAALGMSQMLMHPEDAPDFDILDRAVDRLEAWCLILQIFVQNEELTHRALERYRAVKTGTEQLRKLLAPPEASPAPIYTELAASNELPKEGELVHTLDRIAMSTWPGPSADVLERRFAKIREDYQRAWDRYNDDQISLGKYIQQLRELVDRVRRDLPITPDTTRFLSTLQASIFDLEDPHLDVSDAPEPEPADSKQQVFLDWEVWIKRHNEKKITTSDFSGHLEGLMSRLEGLGEQYSGTYHAIKEMYDQLNHVDDEPKPAPAPAHTSINASTLHLLQLDIRNADQELLSRKIFYSVWRERMMQLFERAKRELEMDETRRVFLAEFVTRLVAEQNEAYQLARENLTIPEVLGTPVIVFGPNMGGQA